MGCSGCSSGSGLPAGCKNNGACGISGCNKLEVFDWLAGIQLPEGQKPFDVVEIRFKNSRKSYFRYSDSHLLCIGDVVVVEANPGFDVGVVSLSGELVRMQMTRKGVKDNHELRKVLRKATQDDIARWQEARLLENATMMRSREIAQSLGLVMKISDVEYQGDKSRAVFYYTADNRVDFRELIKKYAEAFRVRIEMKQIGSRQEASRLGGIGSCGRELCCSTWLTDFRSVSTSAARYQQLALNPQKLAGQCGKLKCCLNYELDSYMEAVREFPSPTTKLFTETGAAIQFKTDIFKRKIWFVMEEYNASNSPICLDLEVVKGVIEMNKKGEKPKDLRELQLVEEEEEDLFYSNVVGQDSLNRFDKAKGNKKRRKGSGSTGKTGRAGGESAQGTQEGRNSRNTDQKGRSSGNRGQQGDRGQRPPRPKGPQSDGGRRLDKGSSDGPKE
jgi:cell fate regulator YaaT (PSP1 superfamily)